MPGDDELVVGAPPDLSGLVQELVEALTDPAKLARLGVVMRNAHAEGATVADGAKFKAEQATKADQPGILKSAEDIARGATAWLLSHMVGHMLGVDVPPAALSHSFEGGNESIVGRAIGRTVLDGIAGPAGELQPGSDGAARLIGLLSNLAITSWFEGVVAEEAAALGGILNTVDKISQLGHDLIDALGLDNLTRVALRGLVQTTIALPLEWQTNKTHRPNLLSEGETFKALLRGDYTSAEATEELSRQGWSQRRIELLLKSALKHLSVDDVQVLRRIGTVGRDFAMQNLREQGWDAPAAEFALVAAEERRRQSFADDSLSALRAAYVDRRIDEAKFRTFLSAILVDEDDRLPYSTAAQTMRELNTRRLSLGQVAAAVEDGILAVGDYRDAVRLEGYDEDAVLVLELQLRHKLDKETTLEQLRAQADAERAADRQRRDDERIAKQAATAAADALKRRGKIGDLEAAFVRGLIPITRLTEVLDATYDADTVAILTAAADDKRQSFLDDQQRRADALKRAGTRALDVGALESAVLEGVLTAEAYHARLVAMGFSADDADVLARTLSARKAALVAATARRNEAMAATQARGTSLPVFEQLVRRGHRTMAEYDALLAAIGDDPATRAAIEELLALHIADDQAAAKVRADNAARTDPKGLTIEQARRAVILGVESDAWLQTYLVDNYYTADAQTVLLAELRDDVAAAAVARQRRATADATTGPRQLPLSTFARAARLSLVTPAAYQAELVARDYAPDDVALEIDLLVHDLADVAAQRAQATAPPAGSGDKALSLAQLAAAVKVGAATLQDYRARAITIGYAPDAVDDLEAVLQDELDTASAAAARRVTIDGELAARQLSLGELEAAVLKGALSLEAYVQQLVTFGYGAADAQLLGALLATRLAGAGAAGGVP